MSGGQCSVCGDYSARLFGPRFATCLDCYAAPVVTAPVAAPNEPTLEQCENVALALGFPLFSPLRHLPHYEQSLRNLHAIVTSAATGEPEANARLAAYRLAFATDRSGATPSGQPKEGVA